MATTKKKKAVKRTVKVATKVATQPSVKAANEWMQQSATLLPFAQGNFSDAAAAAQSATEDLVRMSRSALEQWWSAAQSVATAKPEMFAVKTPASVTDLFGYAPTSIPSFDASAVKDQMTSFVREATEQLGKTTASYNHALNEAASISKENAEVAVEVANITVALSKELGAELISYSNRTFSQNVELSKQVLACRTLNDIFDLGSRVAKTNLDSFFSESVKLSELMFQASTDVAEPLSERVTESSERLSKALAA